MIVQHPIVFIFIIVVVSLCCWFYVIQYNSSIFISCILYVLPSVHTFYLSTPLQLYTHTQAFLIGNRSISQTCDSPLIIITIMNYGKSIRKGYYLLLYCTRRLQTERQSLRLKWKILLYDGCPDEKKLY